MVTYKRLLRATIGAWLAHANFDLKILYVNLGGLVISSYQDVELSRSCMDSMLYSQISGGGGGGGAPEKR